MNFREFIKNKKNYAPTENWLLFQLFIPGISVIRWLPKSSCLSKRGRTWSDIFDFSSTKLLKSSSSQDLGI